MRGSMASIKRRGLVLGGTAAGGLLAASGVALALLVDMPGLAVDLVEGHAPGLLVPLFMRIVIGFVVVWIYVGFRPRFGAGPRASIAAAVGVWGALSAVVASLAALFPILPPLTVALVIVWSLIDLTAASFLGASVYRRHAAVVTRRRGRRVDMASS